jgi:hypothetical protein
VRTSAVTVETRGQYCNLEIEAVEYLQFSGDYVNQAYPTRGNEWRIPRGDVHGINVVFTQRSWDNVDCDLKVYSVD